MPLKLATSLASISRSEVMWWCHTSPWGFLTPKPNPDNLWHSTPGLTQPLCSATSPVALLSFPHILLLRQKHLTASWCCMFIAAGGVSSPAQQTSLFCNMSSEEKHTETTLLTTGGSVSSSTVHRHLRFHVSAFHDQHYPLSLRTAWCAEGTCPMKTYWSTDNDSAKSCASVPTTSEGTQTLLYPNFKTQWGRLSPTQFFFFCLFVYLIALCH